MQDQPVHAAAFWQRVSAGIVDTAILAVAAGVVAGGALLRAPQHPYGLLVLTAGLAMFYRVLFEGSRLKATPGKWLLGLRTTSLAGGQLSYATAALRSWPWWFTGAIAGTLPTAVPAAAVLSALSVLSILLSAERRGLHDRMAGTRVVLRDRTDRDDGQPGDTA